MLRDATSYILDFKNKLSKVEVMIPIITKKDQGPVQLLCIKAHRIFPFNTHDECMTF